jgi:hypothetical protein
MCNHHDLNVYKDKGSIIGSINSVSLSIFVKFTILKTFI